MSAVRQLRLPLRPRAREGRIARRLLGDPLCLQQRPAKTLGLLARPRHQPP
jgi:hypothetical protein